MPHVFSRFLVRPLRLGRNALTAVALIAVSPTLSAAWGHINMPTGASETARAIYRLHMDIFWICVAIGIVVFGIMFYSIFKYRRAAGSKAAKFHDNLALELVWTIIPTVILVLMAIPAASTMIEMYDDSPGEVNIQVIGSQWKWQYKYLEDDIDFISSLRTDWDEIEGRRPKGEFYLHEVDEPLVIPVGKKVRFLITANDVLHAWWVPDLAVKQDAIPGFINTAWTRVDEPGIFRGVCAELCGKNHGFMPIVVRAVPQDEYDAWVAVKKLEVAARREAAEKDWSKEELVSRGEEVFARHCSTCHQLDGKGLPGAFPALAGNEIVLRDPAHQVRILMQGVEGTAMQAFGSQLSPVDIAAVITYTRNAWGNDAKGDGQAVLPREILAYQPE